MLTSDVVCDIASINSFNKMNANINSARILIGMNSNLDEFRGLIKFELDPLPTNAHIHKATLCISVSRCTHFQLYGFNLLSDWNMCSVNWLNQPYIDYKNRIFEKLITSCGRYGIDMTNQVRQWIDNPRDNYGMVLMGMEKSSSNYVQLCTNQVSRDKISLLIEYTTETMVHNVPKFYEYMENVHINGNGEYFSTGVNVSLMTEVAFFIKNNNIAPIKVIAENSPDNIHFAKEIQTIYIEPGESSLLVPINFSKYVRLSIVVAPQGNCSSVTVWLNLQQ